MNKLVQIRGWQYLLFVNLFFLNQSKSSLRCCQSCDPLSSLGLALIQTSELDHYPTHFWLKPGCGSVSESLTRLVLQITALRNAAYPLNSHKENNVSNPTHKNSGIKATFLLSLLCSYCLTMVSFLSLVVNINHGDGCQRLQELQFSSLHIDSQSTFRHGPNLKEHILSHRQPMKSSDNFMTNISAYLL